VVFISPCYCWLYTKIYITSLVTIGHKILKGVVGYELLLNCVAMKNSEQVKFRAQCLPFSVEYCVLPSLFKEVNEYKKVCLPVFCLGKKFGLSN